MLQCYSRFPIHINIGAHYNCIDKETKYIYHQNITHECLIIIIYKGFSPQSKN